MSKNGLFDEFPKVSAKQWKQKIQFELEGADYNETLVWESPEGINVKPFYHSEDLKKQHSLPTTSTDWKIGETIYAGDAAEANKKALNAIKKGAESIFFNIPFNDIQIETLLQGINFNNTPIHLDLNFLSPRYIKSVLATINTKEGNANIYTHTDIIGHLAKTGNWFFNLKKDHSLLTEILNLKHQNTLSIDTILYQNAGANMVEQLGYALSHANEYLNYYKNHDNLSNQCFTFKIAISGNYFFEIAKLKAFRILWDTLKAAYNLKKDCHIVAIPSKRNKTIYDYNVNMLRTTTECMSAILGGANTICNMPYDNIFHKDNEFGERIARNQLLILKKESNFKEVANASDGSYYIETLTHQLAEKALNLFKKIESNGGFLHQLKKQSIQTKIKESAAKEQLKFNSKEAILVGTNAYQDKSHKIKQELELYPFIKKNPVNTIIAPIIEKRLAEELEQKRLKHE